MQTEQYCLVLSSSPFALLGLLHFDTGLHKEDVRHPLSVLHQCCSPTRVRCDGGEGSRTERAEPRCTAQADKWLRALSLQMEGCVSAAPAESTALLSPAGSQLVVCCNLMHDVALLKMAECLYFPHGVNTSPFQIRFHLLNKPLT